MEGKDVLTIIALMLGPVIVAVFTLWAPCTVGPPKARRKMTEPGRGFFLAQLAPLRSTSVSGSAKVHGW